MIQTPRLFDDGEQPELPGLQDGSRTRASKRPHQEGLAWRQPPLLAAVTGVRHGVNGRSAEPSSRDGASQQWTGAVASGQLQFGPNQMPLEEIPPPPVQLALLPEPPPWEVPEPPAPTLRKKQAAPRASRARNRRSGQRSLF